MLVTGIANAETYICSGVVDSAHTESLQKTNSVWASHISAVVLELWSVSCFPRPGHQSCNWQQHMVCLGRVGTDAWTCHSVMVHDLPFMSTVGKAHRAPCIGPQRLAMRSCEVDLVPRELEHMRLVTGRWRLLCHCQCHIQPDWHSNSCFVECVCCHPPRQ
jgi:hypothetical protein